MPKNALKDTVNLLEKARQQKKLPEKTDNPVRAPIVQTSVYVASNGGADFQWTVNMLAQSVTKWNTAGDQRLERLISSNTKERCRQDCFVEHNMESCILGWFQDAIFLPQICKIQNQRQAECYAGT